MGVDQENQTSVDKTPGEITVLLQDWNAGKPGAMDDLVRLVYNDLRMMARFHRGGDRADGVQATELVHELIERFIEKPPDFSNRDHFFNSARLIMRQILFHMARAKNAQKRNQGKDAVAFDENRLEGVNLPTDPEILLALEQALARLGALDERKRQIVELRYFVGQTMEEISEILEISPRTVAREWDFSKKWLARELRKGKTE